MRPPPHATIQHLTYELRTISDECTRTIIIIIIIIISILLIITILDTCDISIPIPLMSDKFISVEKTKIAMPCHMCTCTCVLILKDLSPCVEYELHTRIYIV